MVSCDDDDTLYAWVNLFIRDSVIVSIRPHYHQADTVLDTSSMAIYPGLINTHHHPYQIFSRNLPEVQKMELFPWLVTPYEVWKCLDEEVVTWSALTDLVELLKTGCTTCFDHHYVFPRDAGNLSQRDGGLSPDSVVQTIDEILADSERLFRVWHAPSPCSPFSASGDLRRETSRPARSLSVRLHTQLSQTKDKVQFTTEKFGMRPLQYIESLGWVGPDVWFTHGVHFDDDELLLLAETGTGEDRSLYQSGGRGLFEPLSPSPADPASPGLGLPDFFV